MTTLDWIESSLERSARLGLQVLERASRRKVDWTTPPHIYATDMPEDPVTRNKRSQRELEEAFATIAEYMVQTNYYCKKFYQLAGCVDMPKSEKKHMNRFHKHINAYPPPPGRHGKGTSAEEDFYIEVAPGEYAVSASLPGSQQKTHMINLGAGETVSLTFDL
ncbi:A-kinase-interacting protein 1 [Nerophis ophidion]|uniref:A-kinase-interacting protein 1 n=1 Tax=Nerophis ophidion TaxID=159077 RepID=UPI002ADFD4D8|nr:A-kinase-interacting protein 1 [Nerophis ophidion]